MKHTTITPEKCNGIHMESKGAPECIIDFVPVRKRWVGIGFVQEGDATAADFSKYPVVLRPWINEKKI